MDELAEVKRQNRELAQRMEEETRKDSHSPYAGKCIGIANGQVVAVADDEVVVVRLLFEVEKDARRIFVINPNYDPTKVEYIWRC